MRRRPKSLSLEALEDRSVPALLALDAANVTVSATAGQDQGPDVAMRPDGQAFVVAWEAPDAGGNPGIYFQRYDANWQPAGGVTAVNTFTSTIQNHASVGMDGSGNFVIAWQSQNQVSGASQFDVYARRYNAAGTAIDAAEFLVNTTTTFDEQDPDVAVNSAGQFVITWWGGAFLAEDVFAKGYSGITVGGSGAPTVAFGETTVNNTVGNVDDQISPAVGMDSLGNFVVAFRSYNQAGGTANTYEVVAQRMTAAGARNGAEILVNTAVTADNQSAPDVAMDGSGNFVVVWHTAGVDAAGSGVVMQRYNSGGTPLGVNTLVNTFQTGSQSNAHVAAAVGGDYGVTGEGEETDADALGTDAYYKKYNSGGTVLIGETLINAGVTSLDDKSQANVAVAINAAGDFVTPFESGSGATFDIVLRRFGEAPVVQFASAGSAPSEASATSSYSVSRTGAAYVTANVATDVSVTRTGGTATPGADFTTTFPVTVTIAAGSTSQSAAVALFNDTLFEGNETIIQGLGASANYTISGTTSRTITIVDDDPAPTVSVNSPSVSEGNAGTTTLTFTISIPTASGLAVTGNFATADATATAGSDYVSTSGAFTIPAGSTSTTVSVTVNGDTMFENNETLALNLSGVTNTSNATAFGTGTITNDDTAPTVSVSSPSVTEGDSGTVNLTFTISISAASGVAVAGNYATANVTATAGSDYTALPSTPFTIAAGSTSTTVTVQVTGDTLFEANETLQLNLSGVTGTSNATASGTGTIADDDAAATISISSGNNQSAVAGTNFASPLVALVRNANNNPVQGVSVVFTGPAAGASSVFSTTTNTITITTNASGLASTGTFAANATAGGPYAVSAAATGGTNPTVNFNLTNLPPTSFSIGDVTLSEGNGGTSVLTFTVTASPAPTATATVNWATADGTATTADGDYVAASGSLSFGPGETTKTISITVNGDTKFEGNETFVVNLSGATNAGISDNQGVGTINNDDAAPTLSINDVTVAEGNAGTTSFTFTVTQSAASGLTTTVSYATADGTALAGSDYAANSGTLTFAPGATTQSVTVLVTGDTVFENTQTFVVNLSSPANATIADNQGVGTITNDDAAPTLAIGDVTVSESAGTLTFTVTRTGATEVPIGVSYATTPGTAVSTPAGPGTPDFTATSGVLNFAPSLAATATLTFDVTLTNDTVYEAVEQFTADLSAPTNATLADTSGLGTITNDDAAPTISVGDITVGENGTATFTITLNGPTALPIAVDYATADGTAVATGSATPGTPDYTATTGTLNFPASAAATQTLTVTVPLADDTTNEAAEQFVLNLSNSSNGATIADAQGVATVTDDDPPPTASIDDVSLAEGDSGTTTFTFTVSLSAASAQTVTVNYATADGTALAGTDYAATSGTLTFAPGVTTQTVTVVVTGDTVFEPDQTFVVNLSSPTNATIADNQGVGTITNDDAAPTLAITSISAAEGAGAVTFTVTRTGATEVPVTVNYATADGTAVAGSDYTTASGSVTIPPSLAASASQTFSVTIAGDTADELDETFIAALSGATGATIATAVGTATILDDDLPVAVADTATVLEDGTLTAPSVLGNDNKAPGSVAELVGPTTPNGTLTLNPDGTFTFAPAANFNGTNSFQYRVRNPAAEVSGPVTVTITVTAVNDVPSFTAGPDQTVGRKNGPATVAGWATGISAGPADEAGQALTFLVTTTNDALFDVPPAIDPATGALTFTPTKNGFGTATVTVRLMDNGGTANGGVDTSAARTFTITVTKHKSGKDDPVDQNEFAQFGAAAGPGGPGTIAVFNPNGSPASSSVPFGAGVGVRAVLADFTGDGTADEIAGTGPGVPGRLVVLDPTTGKTILSDFPFGAGFTGGLFVAAGDVNADGRADIVVTPDASGGGRVVIYDGATGQVVASFLGIDDQKFRGGARVAVGDVNGDGVTDVIVSAGLTGGPRVAVFDGTSLKAGSTPKRLTNDFFAFDENLRDGVYVAAGDLNGDGFADLIFGGGPGGGARVQARDGKSLFGPDAGAGQFVTLTNFFAGDQALRAGVQVAVKNADGDALADLVTAVMTPTGPEVKLFLGKTLGPNGGPAITDLEPYPGLLTGIYVG